MILQSTYSMLLILTPLPLSSRARITVPSTFLESVICKTNMIDFGQIVKLSHTGINDICGNQFFLNSSLDYIGFYQKYNDIFNCIY